MDSQADRAAIPLATATQLEFATRHYLKRAISEAAKREDRTVSHWFVRLAEQHPGVQIALQQIGGAGERH